MIDPVNPDLGAVDEMACHANDNDDQRNGPCMLTIAGIAALCIVALAGLSPIILLAVL